MIARSAPLAIVALVATPAVASTLRQADSTSYCLRGTMADGSQTRAGSVAMNRHRLGTRIYLVGSTFQGRRRFVVRDRIGWGSSMDFWSPSCAGSMRWGRRSIRYVVGWR